jgi:tetratricopeptide (TPR) repeat protein
VAPASVVRSGLVLGGLAAVFTAGLLLVFDAPNDDGTVLGDTAGRVGSVTSAVGQGFSGRTDIWASSLELAVDRPWFDLADGERGGDRGSAILRRLLGYGPDTFLFVYPLREDPDTVETIRFTKDGHNQHVQALVEQGILGLLAALSITLVPLAAGGYVLARRSAAYPWRMRMLLAAVLAALAGRGVEQLFGVTQLSGALIYWALLGLLVALSRALPSDQADAPAEVQDPTLHFREAAAGLPVAGVAVALLAMLAWAHAISPVLAARDAVQARDALAAGDVAAAFDESVSAMGRSPTVTSYRLNTVDLLGLARASGPGEEEQLRLLRSSIAVLDRDVDLRPFSIDLNARQAVHLKELEEASGALGEGVVIDAFERTVALLPNHWQPLRSLAVALMDLGRPEEALTHLDAALAMIGDEPEAAAVAVLRDEAARQIE